MPSTLVAEHPLLACVSGVHALLDESTGRDAAFLTVGEKERVLVGLARAVDRIQGTLLRVLAASSEVADEHGCRTAGLWLAGQVQWGAARGRRWDRLARAVDARWPRVGQALAEGRLSLEQAQVLVAGLDRLPRRLPEGVPEEAEALLVGEATRFGPRELRLLARRVLEVVAPDLADEEERKAVEAELRAAQRATGLRLRVNDDGTTEIRARVPESVGARLRTYLDALASPRRTGAPGETSEEGAAPSPASAAAEAARDAAAASEQSQAARWGQAFCALVESLPGEVLPSHGGDATTVVVMIGLDQLRSGAGVGELGSGERIPVGEVRRLACQAGIVPAVLGGKSQVLDLGRTRRLFSPAQRKAMAIRDRACRAEGCEIPAAWCEAHHLDPWSRGGATDLASGVLLCSHHHHRVHDERYEVKRGAEGRFAFHRRT